VNAKDFRNEIVNYVLRYKNKHDVAPRWNEYEKIKVVLEKRMFSATENIMPVVSFGPKGDKEAEEKHTKFVERMIENGYSENQVKILVSWWSQNKKAA
jgi:serine protein kinase